MLRLPIVDTRIPTDVAAVDAIFDELDSHVAAGRRAVIHCMGGLGRTGTVAGCLLVRRGIPAAQALEVVARVRQDSRCPENEAQRDFVRRYRAGGPGAG